MRLFLNDLLTFYKRILDSFNLTFLFSKWFEKGIISIKDLLTESGNFLTFQEFSPKCSCQTNFLQYYQVISAIPKHLLSIAKQTDGFNKPFFTSNGKRPAIFPKSSIIFNAL